MSLGFYFGACTSRVQRALILLAALLQSASVYARGFTVEEIKVVFIRNFLKVTQWLRPIGEVAATLHTYSVGAQPLSGKPVLMQGRKVHCQLLELADEVFK